MTKELSDKKIEAGWHQTFSTGNPFCPCDLKSFTKAVKWTERNIASPQVAPAPTGTKFFTRYKWKWQSDSMQMDPGGQFYSKDEVDAYLATPVQVAPTKKQPTEDTEMSLIESQIEGLLEGDGASEDHSDVKAWLAVSGLRESLVARVHRAICSFERDHLKVCDHTWVEMPGSSEGRRQRCTMCNAMQDVPGWGK